MSRFLRVCVFALLLVASGIPVGANEEAGRENDPENQPIGGLSFQEEIELTVVNVVAFVTDKKGEAITGLSKEDFRIFQDGQERQISHFELYTEELFRSRNEMSEEGAAPSSKETDAEITEVLPTLADQPLYLVLYVDNENLRPLDRNRVLSRASEFVRENLHPPVQMMVLTYDKSLKVAQNFTDDRELIHRALRAQRKKTGGRVTRDQEHKRLLDTMRRDEQGSSGSSTNNRGYLFGQIEALGDEEVNQLLFSLHGIRQAVTMLAGLPGKKSIIYISNGLPLVPTVDLWYAYANAYNDPAALTRMNRYDQTREFRGLASAANSQEVSLYAIGAGGLRGASIGSVEQAGPQDLIAGGVGDQNNNDSLRYMADNTGGQAIVNTNDFSKAFERIAADLFTYYSLGYTLNSSGGDKVHRIKIELPNHPKYEVRYRRRFVEKSLETQVQDRVITNLMVPVEENPLQIITIIGTPAPASEDRWTVPIDISFPLHRVALLPEGDDYVGRAVLFVAVRDSGGGQSDLVRQVHEIRLRVTEYENLKDERWNISAALFMNSGNYTVSVGLMDQVTRQAAFQAVKTTIAGRSR
ncbi:MAG: VWA domain-containing protein [Thermoanaerobaculales bacterium]|nr:VWA domain-containing protein [Thermoanaerobaculales bacterium]